MNHLQMAHLIMEQTVQPGDHVADMTLGNGHDMRKLLKLCGAEGQFTGFDIARPAIDAAEKIAEEFPGYRIRLHHRSHARCEDMQPFRCAVYNLGYLPGSDKSITTKAESTLASLENMIPKMLPGGRICVTAYRTHDGGKEAAALLDWLQTQDTIQVRTWQLVPDDGHCPILYVIQHREVRR